MSDSPRVAPEYASAPHTAQASNDAVSARTVVRPTVPAPRCHRSATVTCPVWALRLSRRSSASVRTQPATAQIATHTPTSPSAPHRYQRTKPEVRVSAACARAATVCSGSSTCAAAALRCTGPRVICGRIGPHTCSGAMSRRVLPICTSWAGPDTDGVGVRAPSSTC